MEPLGLVILAAAMVPVIIIDIRRRIIPNQITYGLILAGFLLSLLPGHCRPIDSLLGIVFGGGILYLVGLFGKKAFKKEGMGGGDIKLLAGMGAFLGPAPVIGVLFFGSLSALAVIAVTALRGRTVLGRTIAFGPFLALGLYITLILMFQTEFLKDYLAFYAHGF